MDTDEDRRQRGLSSATSERPVFAEKPVFAENQMPVSAVDPKIWVLMLHYGYQRRL